MLMNGVKPMNFVRAFCVSNFFSFSINVHSQYVNGTLYASNAIIFPLFILQKLPLNEMHQCDELKFHFFLLFYNFCLSDSRRLSVFIAGV